MSFSEINNVITENFYFFHTQTLLYFDKKLKEEFLHSDWRINKSQLKYLVFVTDIYRGIVTDGQPDFFVLIF